MLAQDSKHTGRFFGEVRGPMMQRLIVEKIFQKVRINDYQAVCFERKSDGSPGNILKTVNLTNKQIISLLFFIQLVFSL